MNQEQAFHSASSTQAYLDQIPAEVQLGAVDYTHGSHWIILFSALVGVAINLLIVRLGLLARLRQRWGRRPWSAALLVFATYYLLAFVLDLPWAMYTKWWREVDYGLSQQTAPAWLVESIVSACFSAILLGVVVAVLYALIRKAPRTWWLWSGLVASTVIVFAIVIAPAAIEPRFNEFKPLAEGRHRDVIVALANRAGMSSAQIVSYDGSKQSNNYTAHVSGLFGTERIAVSDALLAQASEAELRAVVGHEIGHFVLHHELWTALGYSALLILAFWITHLLYAPLLRVLGTRTIAGLADPAGLPLLSIILTLCLLVFTPLTNGIVRVAENQADAYSLEHVGEPDGMAIALLRTANYRAASPGWLEEWLFYDHPAIARRIGRTVEWKQLHARNTENTDVLHN